MDVFGRIAQTDRIQFDDEIIARQRRAMIVLANWASDCMVYDEGQARAFETRVVRALDGGATVDRLIAEIGTEIERAGKPSVAGLAGMMFARAMQIGDRTVEASTFGERRRDAPHFKSS